MEQDFDALTFGERGTCQVVVMLVQLRMVLAVIDTVASPIEIDFGTMKWLT